MRDRMPTTRTDRLKIAILLIALAGLMAGLALWGAGRAGHAGLVWTLGVVPALAALLAEIARSIRRGEVGLDIVAALSMTAALVFGETLAAAVVAVMYSAAPSSRPLPRAAPGARCTPCWRGCPAPPAATAQAGWTRCRWTPSPPATGC